MNIDKLPNHTVEDLCNQLERVPTLGWKRLMLKGFSFYNDDDVHEIEAQGGHRSKSLLDDLIGRKQTVENLIEALKIIGNLQAVELIRKGVEDLEVRAGIFQDSGTRPPGRSRQPQEHEWTPPMMRSSGEQTETLQFPVQESTLGLRRLTDCFGIF